MPLVTSTIPNLINGVSQQPASLRLASQAEQVVNCMPSPVEGLKKRPPSHHVKRLFTGTVGTRRPFVHVVDRDENTRYMILLQDNNIRVFDLDGNEKTVSKPNGTGYLDIAGEPSQQFRVASVADYTFIVNREKTVTLLSDLSPGSGSKGLVFIRSAEYDCTYRVKVGTTEVTFKTAPAGGKNISASYSQSLTTVTVTATAHGLVNGDTVTVTPLTGDGASGTYTVVSATTNTFQYTAAQSQTTSGNCTVNYNPTLSTTEIALQLKTALSTALGGSWTVTNQDYVIVIVKNDGADYTLASGDSRNGEATVPIKGTVPGLTDLPTIAPHGLTIKVQGSQETEYDDYYIVFEATAGSGTGPGQWRETVAPGIQYKLDPATMPYVLVREADGTFTFEQFGWSPRLSGDTSVSPNPSFVGVTINNITLFRNRLVLLADENVILSAADEYDRFFPETVQTVVDSDPIDLTCGGNRINFLLSAIPFASTLMLFSRHGQFRLDSGTYTVQNLTPKTANITQMTAFEMSSDVDPVAAGRTIYFSIPRGDFSGIREFFLPEASSPIPNSEEVTSSVPRYVPANLSTMIATISEEAIVAISKDQPKRLYLYKFFFQDEEKLQSAWSYWEYEGAKTLLGADFVDSDLYLVVEYSDGVYLEKTVIRPENVDPGAPIELLVDRKVDETLCTKAITSSPTAVDVQTTITLPYPINSGSRMIVVGRYATTNTIQAGQVIEPISQTSNTLTVRGNLTAAKFYIGERYDMLYEFSTQYLKEQPPGGGMAVISGPRLQLRTWTMIFDQSSAFQIRVTPRTREPQAFPYTYPYGTIGLGDSDEVLGQLNLKTSKFRVPVLTQNIDAKVEILSDSPLPCRMQSAEWEGWYHTRSQRL
jgi:hypothetical protein